MFRELEGADGLELAIVQGEYRGHAVQRVLIGPINDLAATSLGDNLVITMPAAALPGVVDAWLDSEAGPVPFVPTSGNLTAVSYSDTAGELRAMAGFIDLLVQPIAYAARVSLLEERDWLDHGVHGGGFDDWDWDAQDWSDGYVYSERDVTAIEYSVIGPGTHSGVITAVPDASIFATYFLLEGITPGQEFTVSQTSTELDSYLNLIELETGSVIAYNDDYGGTRDSTIVYTAAEGITYLVEATTWSNTGTGAFVLEVSLADGTDDAMVDEADAADELPPVPSFAELVGVGERFPAAVRIIADRSGPAYGHTEVIGDTIRSRMFYTFDW